MRDSITLEKLREHITCRDSWHEKMITNFLQVNNQFASKFSSQQPTQSESPLVLSRKIKSSYSNNSSLSDHIPKIHIKNSYIQSSETSSESSRRSSVKTQKPHKSSMGDETGSESLAALDSKRLFRTNSKISKFGLAYEKHQTKLKKYFSDKDREPESSGLDGKKSKSKLNLKLLTCPDSATHINIKDPFSDYGQSSNYFNPRKESSMCSSGSAEGLALFRCHTEEGAPSVFPFANFIKPHNMPMSIKSINSPQFRHIRTNSGPFHPTDTQKVPVFKQRMNISTTENDRSRTEESSEIDRPFSIGINKIKRTSSFAMRTESRIIITPNTISTFRKKS